MGNETRAYVIIVSEATVGFKQENVVTCFALKFQKVKSLSTHCSVIGNGPQIGIYMLKMKYKNKWSEYWFEYCTQMLNLVSLSRDISAEILRYSQCSLVSLYCGGYALHSTFFLWITGLYSQYMLVVIFLPLWLATCLQRGKIIFNCALPC